MPTSVQFQRVHALVRSHITSCEVPTIAAEDEDGPDGTIPR